jgi:flagellar motor protein MotB
MHRSWTIGLVLPLLGLLAAGCQNKLHDENMALHRQNRELQSDRDRLSGELASRPDPSQLASMQQEIANRDAQIAQLQSQLRAPQPGQPAASNSDLAGIEVTRDDRAGTLTVNLPGDVLFDSGKAELKTSARTTLNKVVAAVRKEYPGKKVIVEGYSDTDPITRTKDQWKDNLDLSAARARTVATFLVDQGIESRSVGTRAFGDTKPRSSKAASRRVEIVVATR